MQLVRLQLTSIAAPSQWQGELSDGRFLYARYRHSHGMVSIGASPQEAVEGEVLLEWPEGEAYAGWPSDDPRFSESFLSTEELLARLQAVGVDVSEVEMCQADD